MWSTPLTELKDRLSTQWGASAYSAVPVEYDNEPITRPNPDPNDIVGSSFVRQHLMPDALSGLTFTNDISWGIAGHSIFTPIGADLATAYAMAGVIYSIFNRYESSGLVCVGLDGSGPYVTRVGRNDEISFHELYVTVPWQYSDTASTGGVVAGKSLTLIERQADPSDPPEGEAVIWMSDGTGIGDDGDILIKVTAGGVTKTITLIDKSAVP